MRQNSVLRFFIEGAENNGIFIKVPSFSKDISYRNKMHFRLKLWLKTSLVAQIVKASAYDMGDPGLIPGSGRSSGEGNGNPLQYTCLEKSHGWRSLVGYGPWGHKELETIEQLNCFTHLNYLSHNFVKYKMVYIG